jgi:hypothetical protein
VTVGSPDPTEEIELVGISFVGERLVLSRLKRTNKISVPVLFVEEGRYHGSKFGQGLETLAFNCLKG